MTIVYNLNLIKKNLILFIIFVIIFFSISYSLTSFQLKQTENLSSINLEILSNEPGDNIPFISLESNKSLCFTENLFPYNLD